MAKKTNKNSANVLGQNFTSKEEFLDYFNSMYRQGIEQLLKAELKDHLGYEPHAKEGYNSGNSRNGSFEKTVKSENLGDMVLNIPRDRNGTYEPKLIPKGQTMTEHLEQCILSLYSKGMTTSDISDQIHEMYGVSVSQTTISNITNTILKDIESWHNRPLEDVYLTGWMDGIVFKVKEDNKFINKCIHIVLGLRNDGYKEVLGLWINTNESSTFWLGVLTDLKARGVKDILIACTDNLTGFTQAINSIFPETITQLCVVHQIRNACKYVVWKDIKEFCKDQRLIYTAANEKQAQVALNNLEAKWNKKYKHAIQSWKNNWTNLMAFMNFPPEIRTIIYTTNTIENLNRNIRKYTKTKVQFPTENALLKAAYLAVQNVEKKWNHKPRNWGLLIQQFMIIFDNRTGLKI
ncbi:MAG: hypothetical protein RLZZ118_1562 [Bacteroidota bacterium]|jgi:transposase-like protein